MEDKTQADRLYEERMAHNYGYYAFGYGKIYSKAASLVDFDGVTACKNVNFGINKEKGIRRLVLEMLYHFVK